MRRKICAGVSVVFMLAALPAQTQEKLEGKAVPLTRISFRIAEPKQEYRVQRAQTAPVIDGDDVEWRDVPAMILDNKAQSGRAWTGPEDLHGSMKLLWDQQALYFCLTVVDDVHFAPKADGGWWENDCCQFGFDAYMNGPVGGYDSDELSFCVSDSPKGPVLCRYRGRGMTRSKEQLISEVAVKMTAPAATTRVYEWSMPWALLEPVSPGVLGRSGFCFTLNDNDGKGFKSALAWTPGLVFGQDASRFGQIMFDGAEGSAQAALALRGEPMQLTEGRESLWLDLPGVAAAGTARLLVRTPKAQTVEATVSVVPRSTAGADDKGDKDQPVATGRIQYDVPEGKTVCFVWDLAPLPVGDYELIYAVPTFGRPAVRLPYQQRDLAQLKALSSKRPALLARFGIDRPWDDLANAPAIDRRHRGLVAASLAWMNGPGALTEIEQLAALNNAAAMVADLEAGVDYLGKQRNEFWSAYYSAADGSGQFFVTSVPADYDAARAYPLIVNLHGSSGRPKPNPQAVCRDQYITVQPWGRGDLGYRALGEDDVLQVIRYMKEWYHIDSDRVYLTGLSMGGYGTWYLATRHPDLFAAAAPVKGGADYMALSNLPHVPIYNQHGAKDWVVSIDHSRLAVQQLQQLGYAVIHQEYAESSHGLAEARDPARWLLQFTRVRSPQWVSWACEDPANGRAYWLNVRRFQEPHRDARVTARVLGSGAEQAVSLGLENVSVLELDVQTMPIQRDQPLLVQVGVVQLRMEAPLPGTLFVVRDRESWSLASQWSSPASPMRPYRPGGAATLYDGQPLLIVYGTTGAEKRSGAWAAAAKKLSTYGGSGSMVAGGIPIKADVEVREDDLQHFNLLLLGGPADNALAAKVAGKLPLELTASNHLLVEGRKPLALERCTLQLTCYNPLAPSHLIHLVALFADDESMAKELDKPQWAMRSDADLTVRRVGGPLVRQMQFTDGWAWRHIPGEDKPAPGAINSQVKFATARLQALREATRADFVLDDVSKKDTLRYDADECTVADLGSDSEWEQSVVGTMTGQELLDASVLSGDDWRVLVVPDCTAATVDPRKTYTIAVSPGSLGTLAGRQRNLSDLSVGPAWRMPSWEELAKAAAPSASPAATDGSQRN